jgi:hypothetical protein
MTGAGSSLEEGVPIIPFWRDPPSLVPRAKADGATVLHTVARPDAGCYAFRSNLPLSYRHCE